MIALHTPMWTFQSAAANFFVSIICYIFGASQSMWCVAVVHLLASDRSHMMLLQCSMICFMFKHQQPMLTLGDYWPWQLYFNT